MALSKIKIFALGGLNEIDKNMYVVEVENNIFVFDAGLKYGNDKMLGIDYIIPSFEYLVKNKDKIKGVFITHGHDSNMGAISDLVKAIPEIKVYATKFTMEVIKNDLISSGITKANLIEIKPHVNIAFSSELSVFPISVTHSIPDAVCYVLYTKDGSIIYTGDFVFDSNMQGSYKTDIGKLAYVGKQGVLCLLSESIYAEKQGFTCPNNRINDFIAEVFSKHEDRIIATILPAHIYRVQEIFDEISKTHRKVVIMGKSLQDLINKAIDMKYIDFDKDRIGDLANLDDKGVVVLISDEREKPFANLERILKGFDKYIKLKDTDTIFITEPSYDGMEKRYAVILDEIAKDNLDVVCLSSKTHLLHHASREDLAMMINLMNPKYYFPVKGEYRHQYMNADIANDLGIPKENIILKLNGDVAEFIDGNLQETNEHIDVDEILIDGKSENDIGELVLKDREMLGENGIVIISATLDKMTKKLIAGPEILTRGFIYVKENQDMIEITKEISLKVINDNINEATNKVDYTKIKNEVREELGNYFYKETEAKPMIITVIQEI